MQAVKKKSAKFIQLCKKYEVNPDNIPHEVWDFKDACKITGDDPKTLDLLTKFVKHLPKRHQKYMIAAYVRPIIAEALKNNKRPDYTKNSKQKQFCLFKVQADKKRPSGFNLTYYGNVNWFTHVIVGVRLSLMNHDTVKFFGMHFMQYHKDYTLYT